MPLDESTVGLGEEIPPIPAPKKGWFWRDERKQFEKDGAQTHNIRRIAAYGAIILVVLLYGAGVLAIGLFLGLVPGHPRVTSDMWHIVVATLAALFTVPTILAVAVLKLSAASEKNKDEIPLSVQEAFVKVVAKAFEKSAS